MSNRKGKAYSVIQDEIDEIIYQREKKELDAFFNKHNTGKKTSNSKKDSAKYKKSDLIFVFFYFLIYFILLVILLYR